MTFEELAERIPTIARQARAGFVRYTERSDIEQELWMYLYANRRKIEGLLDTDEEYEAVRALEGAARIYCEKEKAAQSGYEFDDVAFYSPSKLADLLPLALNPKWDGMTGDSESEGGGSADPRTGGTLLAAVADVRRAVQAGRLPGSVGAYDPETEAGMAYLEALTERLGGQRPTAPGYGRTA